MGVGAEVEVALVTPGGAFRPSGEREVSVLSYNVLAEVRNRPCVNEPVRQRTLRLRGALCNIHPLRRFLLRSVARPPASSIECYYERESGGGGDGALSGGRGAEDLLEYDDGDVGDEVVDDDDDGDDRADDDGSADGANVSAPSPSSPFAAATVLAAPPPRVSWAVRQREVAAHIVRTNADVLCLQEVRGGGVFALWTMVLWTMAAGVPCESTTVRRAMPS